MNRLKHPITWLLLWAVVCALGCAGTPAAFSTKYPDNDTSELERLVARLESAPPRPPGTIVIGITAAPVQLYAFDLAEQRVLWKQVVDATSAPFIAGESVVYQTASSIVVCSLRTGQRQANFARGDKTLRGADGEGALAAITIAEGMGTYAKSEVLLLRRGQLDWRRPIQGLVGAPAVVGGSVLVPWSSQYVTAVDAATGSEVARIRVRDGVLAHALRDRGQTYIGSQHGVVRVTTALRAGKLRDAGLFQLPERNLPGRPLLLRNVYGDATPQGADSAQHRIALAWVPRTADGARVALEDDTIYLVFYRFVFALSPSDYAVRWVHRSDGDVVGAAAQPGGVLVADESGKLLTLAAASGSIVARLNSGLQSTVVRIPVGALALEPGVPLSEEERRGMLLAAAQDTDARMVPARLLALRALAKLQTADATANLITLCEGQDLAPAVRTEACTALRSRELGSEHLLSALARRASYLTGTRSPAVAAFAKAAVGAKEHRAVEPLSLHLHDPNTTSADLPATVTALAELGDASTAETLSAFLQRYNADPVDPELVVALERIPAALQKLQGQAALPVLEAVMGHALGVLSVRQKAHEVVDALRAQAAAEQAAAEAAQNPESEELPVASPVDADTEAQLPTHLSAELLDKALRPSRDALQACLAAAGEYQARTVLVIEDGALLMVSVLPAKLQTCIEPIIRKHEFPKTRYPKKERVTHIVKR